METLVIKETTETPLITLNGDDGYFSIAGKSYPENVLDYFKPVFDYIEVYKQEVKEKTTLEFNLVYYNTATSKIIVKLILTFMELNKPFQVRWICKNDDELMIEKGEELKEVLECDIEIVLE